MRYFVIEMPINKDGNGPEMDANEVSQILYQIWDTDFMAVASYTEKTEADYQCDTLNREYYG